MDKIIGNYHNNTFRQVMKRPIRSALTLATAFSLLSSPAFSKPRFLNEVPILDSNSKTTTFESITKSVDSSDSDIRRTKLNFQWFEYSIGDYKGVNKVTDTYFSNFPNKKNATAMFSEIIEEMRKNKLDKISPLELIRYVLYNNGDTSSVRDIPKSFRDIPKDVFYAMLLVELDFIKSQTDTSRIDTLKLIKIMEDTVKILSKHDSVSTKNLVEMLPKPVVKPVIKPIVLKDTITMVITDTLVVAKEKPKQEPIFSPVPANIAEPDMTAVVPYKQSFFEKAIDKITNKFEDVYDTMVAIKNTIKIIKEKVLLAILGGSIAFMCTKSLSLAIKFIGDKGKEKELQEYDKARKKAMRRSRTAEKKRNCLLNMQKLVLAENRRISVNYIDCRGQTKIYSDYLHPDKVKIYSLLSDAKSLIALRYPEHEKMEFLDNLRKELIKGFGDKSIKVKDFDAYFRLE